MKTFKQLFTQARKGQDYYVQGAILEFTEALYARMAAHSVSKAELANRLGTSRAYVTQLMGGNTNLTLRSMAKIALALGYELKIDLRPISDAPMSDTVSNGLGASNGRGLTSVRGTAGSRSGVADVRSTHSSKRRRKAVLAH